VDLAKDWRMDKYLRNLEAMLIVTDGRELFVITGAGDVLEPEHDVAAIGSGGNYALAAARGLMATDMDAEGIARAAMAIAAEICVYTNGNLTNLDKFEAFSSSLRTFSEAFEQRKSHAQRITDDLLKRSTKGEGRT
jgi:ATP-dependent protease HslVU peptidase subunit